MAFWIFAFFQTSNQSSKKTRKTKTQLFGESSRSSSDSFELESDSNECEGDWLNSLKSCVLDFSRFFEYRMDQIEPTNRWIHRSIISIEGRRAAQGK